MAAKRKRAGIEWVRGIVSMPAYVTGEGEPYRPEVLLWMSAHGLVLGTTTAKPGEVVAAAPDHLRSTIERPMIGRPHAPTRVGMAKSAFMAGRDAGFDMESMEGIEAWMRAQSRPLPASVGFPPFGAAARPIDPAATGARKNQRKTARTARKRNR